MCFIVCFSSSGFVVAVVVHICVCMHCCCFFCFVFCLFVLFVCLFVSALLLFVGGG